MRLSAAKTSNHAMTLEVETNVRTTKFIIIIAALVSILILLGCQKYSVYVTVLPSDTSGTIELAPDPDSSGRYKAGTEVRLLATPGTDPDCKELAWVFLEWSGHASGSFPTALIQIDGDRHVTAEFGCNNSSTEQE